MSAASDATTPADWLRPVLQDARLGAGTKVVAGALMLLADETCHCSASLPAIAILIAASERTAKRGVQILVNAGWLAKIREGGGRTSTGHRLVLREGPILAAMPEMTPVKSAPLPDLSPLVIVDRPALPPQRLTPAELEAVLRKAGGCEGDQEPSLSITGPIDALIDEGYDLEREILPVIRALAAKGRTWTTWRYVVPAIREQNDAGAPISPPGRSPSSGKSSASRAASAEPEPIDDRTRSRYCRLRAGRFPEPHGGIDGGSGRGETARQRDR